MSCFCRTLLASIALSCTLSNIHGQATQRLDRIKDVMCVLLMSGMQKEDLDVSMLNKLQRHKVNIGDMNNEELLHECTSMRALDSVNNSFEVTTTVNKENLNEGKTDTVSINNNGISTKDKEESTTKDIIQYIDGQPEMQSVLKFWQDIKVNMSNNTPRRENNMDKTHSKNEQKNKRNIQSNTYYKETDTIQKILANFVMQSRNDNSVQSSTAKESINGRKQYFPPTYNDNFRYSDQNSPSNSYRVKQLDPYLGMPQGTDDIINISKVTAKRNKNNATLNDMFTVFNKFKTLYPGLATIKNNESINPIQDIHLSVGASTEKVFTTTAKISEQIISQNMIKEIVISVKDMVLSELRKEFLKITPTIPTTATTTSTEKEIEHITPKTNKNIEETILNKFMDLFKEIKSLKKKTIILSDGNNAELTKMNRFQQRTPSLNQMELSEPTLNNFGVDQHTNKKPPLTYEFSPQVHKYRSYGAPKPVQRDLKPIHLITVQTNNVEIPPLGIPIDIPENPINQNIIVTTTPYRIGPNKIERDLKFESSIGIEDFITQPKPLTNRYIDTPQYYSNFQPDYQNYGLPLNRNSRINYNGQYKTKNSINSNIPDNFHKAKATIPFHEKLENMNIEISEPRQRTDIIECCNEKYAYSKQMVECCNKKIASRQQMSLSNVKKQVPYDDTHFNNFLKSQQKVTDMLERILASKNKVQSVEIA